jgi:hypothetical protein
MATTAICNLKPSGDEIFEPRESLSDRCAMVGASPAA